MSKYHRWFYKFALLSPSTHFHFILFHFHIRFCELDNLSNSFVFICVLVARDNRVVVWFDDVGTGTNVRAASVWTDVERYIARDTKEHSKYKQTNGTKQVRV